MDVELLSFASSPLSSELLSIVFNALLTLWLKVRIPVITFAAVILFPTLLLKCLVSFYEIVWRSSLNVKGYFVLLHLLTAFTYCMLISHDEYNGALARIIKTIVLASLNAQ